MKKNKFFLFSIMAFYIGAGALACCFFFLRGSSLSGNAAVTQTELYEIKPELSQAAIPESTEILLETTAAVEETLPAPTETETETEPEPEPVYYAFTTLNINGSLHVREGASMNAKIVARFAPGITGYVLEKGPVWSLVQSGDIIGYVFNEYLDFREIPKEEYPFQ